jgi:acyl-homoserine lactone acylase PvdQ
MYFGALPSDRGVGPGLRFAIDLGDLDHPQYGLAGGQSGHTRSPHYDDALRDWLRGRPRPLWLHPRDLEYLGKGRWTLHPALLDTYPDEAGG